MTSIEEAYYFSLRVEEKLKKRFQGRKRGCGQGGIGCGRSSRGRNETQKKNEDVGTTRNQRNEGFNHSRDQNFGDQRGRGRGRGQGLGGGGFRGTYFHCNEEGHHAFEFPQWQGRTYRRADGHARVAHVDEDVQLSYSKDAKRGEVLIK